VECQVRFAASTDIFSTRSLAERSLTRTTIAEDGKYLVYRSRGVEESRDHFDTLTVVELDDSRLKVVKTINPLVGVDGSEYAHAPEIECEPGDNILSSDGRFVLLTTNLNLSATSFQKYMHWLDVSLRDLEEARTISISDNKFRNNENVHDCHSAGMSRNGAHVGYFCTDLGSSQNLYLASVDVIHGAASPRVIHDLNPLLGTEDPNIGVDSISNDGTILMFSTGVDPGARLPSLAPGAANPRQIHTYIYNSSNPGQPYNIVMSHYSHTMNLLLTPSKSAAMTPDATVMVVLSADVLNISKQLIFNNSGVAVPYVIDAIQSQARPVGLPFKLFDVELDNARGTPLYSVGFLQPTCLNRMYSTIPGI
jgi:hypothetical protein